MRSLHGPRLRPLAFVAVAAACMLWSQARAGEPMSLTDILGRSIRAEPISLDGDALKIRREDGREFTLELKSLIDDDQAKIRALNLPATAESAGSDDAKPATKEKPKYVPDMTKVQLSLSRFKGDTNTISKWEGYSHKHEMWGYSFQVTNRNLHPIENVRIEYNLFARTYSDSGTPAVVPGTINLPPVGSNRFEGAKTKTAEVCKQKGYDMANTGGELRGVWVKLYVGDKVIQEQVSPNSLKSEVEWTDPQEGGSRPRTRIITSDGWHY